MKISLFVLTVFSASYLVQCADILAVIPTPFYSHQATFRPLWRELAKKGHKITLITTDLMEKNENITQLDYSGAYELLDKKNFGDIFKDGFNIFKIVKKFSQTVDKFMEFQFKHPDLVKLMNEREKFDVMLVELIMPGWPLLSAKFKCPMIGLSTMDGHPAMHAAVGNAIHPVIYPYADLGLGEDPSLLDRVKSVGFLALNEVLFKRVLGYISTSYVRSLIDKDLPDILDVTSKVDMIFINSNPVFFPPRPITPATINLGGGLHFSEPKKLPQDLQEFLDDSVDGCIYVSFGTTVNSEYLSREQKNVLVNVFKAMAPMRILWKFDDVKVASGAKNIEVRTWVPQQDILRHPNVKLFITQGGLQSMEEAIDSAVPMLGMPFYGDQLNNVNKMEYKKFGLKLNPKDMNEQSLKKALEELLDNKTYKQTIEKLSAIARDQPMNGLEKAVWWTEYVLRHKGTQHLRSPSADIPLYQYYFIDVILTIAVFLFLSYKFLATLHKYTFKIVSDAFYAIKPPKTKKE